MRPRKQLTLVELMVIMAIVGILAAIVLPAARQAKERVQVPRAAAPQAPIEPAGQLNTIEVSEYSTDSPEGGSDQWERIIAPFLPMAFMAVVAFVVVTAMRRQMARRAGQ